MLGARLVLADVAAADGTPRHDPELLAGAYEQIFQDSPPGASGGTTPRESAGSFRGARGGRSPAGESAGSFRGVRGGCPPAGESAGSFQGL
jgi:hypothetical protein